MTDIRSDIIINVDTSIGIAEIKNLQRQISELNAQLLKSGAQQARAAQNIQRNLINNINATGQFAASVRTISSTAESFTTALERNKLGMGEYFKYAGGASKTFGKLFKKEFDTIQQVAESRVKTLQTQYIKLGRDANGALKAIQVRPLALDMDNLATKTAIAAQRQQLFNQLLKQGSTNLLNFGKNTQWAGRQLMVGFTIPLAYLGSVASKTFMQMEEQAIRFKRVYGDTFTASAETDKMIDQVKQLAGEFTKYGVQVEKTMKMAADAAAMGKQGADLLAQIKQASNLAVLGGVEQDEALETTISLTNAFGIAADKLASKINFLNAVENQTVTAIQDLTIAIPKAAPVIQQLGGDVEDLAFFLTAMKEGGINASEGANALKSGLASLINPTAKATEFLQGFGINLKGIVEANKGDVKGLVVEFAQALDTLDPLNKARAIEQLFGKFQFSRLSTLFQNVIAQGSQAERVLKLTRSSSEELAILAERELKRVEDSPMYKFKKAVEDLKVSLVPLGEAFLKAVTPLVEFAKGFLDRFNQMSDGAKQFAVIATTVVAGIGPVLLMTFGLIANGVANLIKMFAAISNIFKGAGKSSTDLGLQTEYMTQQQLEAAAVAASLDQSHSKLIQTFGVEAAAVDKLATAYARAVVAQSKLMGRPIGPTNPAGQKPMKLQSGILSVPGPKGAGDIVPAMLSPGEAVIPAKQSEKYAGLIQGMMNDEIPGFRFGRNPFASMLGRSRVAVRMKQADLESAIATGGKNAKYSSAFTTNTGADYLSISGLPNPAQKKLRMAMERDVMGLGPDTPASQRPTYGYARTSPLQALINRLFGFKGRQFNDVTSGKRIGDLVNVNGFGSVKPYTEIDRSDVLRRYGDVDLITKRSVGKRSSVAVGDSLIRYNRVLNGRHPQVPINPRFGTAPMQGATQAQLDKAMFSTLSEPFGSIRKPGTNIYTSNPKPPYIETYTPGGFKLSEVSRIIARDRGTAKQLQKLVDDAGLRIKVTPQNAPMVVRMLSNIIGSRFNDGVTGSQSKEYAKELGKLRERLRGAPDSISKEFKSRVDYANETSLLRRQEDRFIGILAKKYGYTDPAQLRNVTGSQLSHIDKEYSKISIAGAKEIDQKVWKIKNLQADSALVNQGLEMMSKVKTFDSFVSTRDANAMARATGLTPQQVSAELDKLKRGTHPTTVEGYKVAGQFAKEFSAAYSSTKLQSVKVAAMLGDFIDYRMARLRLDQKRGKSSSYLSRLSSMRVQPKDLADERYLASVDAKARASHGNYIAKFNERMGGKPLAPEKKISVPKKTNAANTRAPRGAKPIARNSKQQAAISIKDVLGFSNGVVSVPGPKGAGDVVPAMLTPGEAVIPAEMSKKYAPLISGMVNDSLPGYNKGRLGAAAQALAGFTNKSSQLIGSAMGEALGRSKQFASSIGTSVVGAMNNSPLLAKAASRLTGGATDVVTSDGRVFNNGIEVRKDKNGREYYVQPGKGRISADEAMKNSSPAPTKPSLGSRISAKAGTIGMVGSTIGMGMMMSGDPGMQQAGGAVMAGSMVASLLPMITNPIGLAVAALAGLGATIFLLNQAYNDNVKKTYEMTMAMGGSTKAIRKLSEFSGKVSAGEIMDKRRAQGVDIFQIAEGKTDFGSAFLQSENGKALKESLSSSMKLGGREAAATTLSNQMATAVASGALSAGQARDIVAALGKELDDYSFSIGVNSKLLSLLGPNGENLLTDPLDVRLDIVKNSQKEVKKFGKVWDKEVNLDIANDLDQGAFVGSVAAIAGSVALISTALAPVTAGTSLIIAGLAAAVAGTAAYFATAEDFSKDAAATGGFVANSAIALQTNKEMLDSLQIQYEQEKAIALAKGDQAEASRLDLQYAEDRQALLSEYATTVKDIQDAFNSAENKGSVLDRYQELTKEVYKDDPLGTAILDGIESKLDALDDEKEVVIRAAILSKDLSPTAAESLLSGENIDRNVSLYVKLGGSGYSKLEQTVALFDEGSKTKEAFRNKVNEFVNPVDAEKFISSFDPVIQALSAMGGKTLSAGLEFYFANPEALTEANAQITEFKKQADKGPITQKMIQEVYGQEMVDKIKTNQAYFDSLPDDQKVIYTTVLKMIGEMDPTAKMIAAINFVKSGTGATYFKKMTGLDYATASSSSTFGTDWVNSQAIKVFDTYGAEAVTTAANSGDKTPTTTPPPGGGGNKETPYDDILKDLRRVRDWTIKTAGGFKELNRVMNRYAKDKNNMKMLGGVESKLLEASGASSVSAPLASYFAGLDEKVQKTFFTIKNGKLTLTSAGKLMKAAFDERAIGNVYVGLQGSLKTIKAQNVATKKLVGMGLDWADASELAGDAELAAAINSGKNAAEIARIVKLKKEELELTKKTNALLEARIAIQDNEKEFKNNDLIAAYSLAERNAINSSSELQELIKTGQQGTEEFGRLLAQEVQKSLKAAVQSAKDALDQAITDFKATSRAERMVRAQFDKTSPVVSSVILNDAQLMEMITSAQAAGQQLGSAFYDRLKQLLSDPQTLGQVFDDGLNKAFQAIDVQEKAIEIKFEADTSYLTDPENGIIPKAQRQIAELEYAVDDYNYALEQISQKEDEINQKYEDRFKALDEVRKVNDRLIAQEQAQLNVADALTRGDVAAAARAVQDYRAKQVQTNADAQRTALETAKQKELDALTATVNGKTLTRKQIEKELLAIKNQILEIEEKTLEPAEKALKNFTDQRDIAISNVTVLGMTRAAWEGIQNQVQLASINNNAFLASLIATLSTVEALKKAYGELGGSTPGSVNVATAPAGGVTQFVTPATTKPVEETVTINPNLTAAPEAPVAPAPTEPAPTVAAPTVAAPTAAAPTKAPTKAPTTVPPKKVNPAWTSQNKVVSQLETDLSGLKSQASSVSKTIASLQKQIKDLTGVAGMTSVVTSLKNQLAGKTTEGSYLASSISMKTTELSKAKTKLAGITQYLAKGGSVKGYNLGGFVAQGTDIVPAMLTPGEFVVRKYAVDNFGLDNLKAINSGTYQGESVYNYEVNVNVKSDADADQIARAVISQINQIDSQRVRGNRF